MKPSDKPKQPRAMSIIQNIVCIIGWLIIIPIVPLLLLGICSGAIKK